MLNLPLGQIVALGHPRQRKGDLCLVDGARRLAALSLFSGVTPPWASAVPPGFALTGLQRLPELNGATKGDFVAIGTHYLDNACLRLAIVDRAEAPDPAALRQLVQG